MTIEQGLIAFILGGFLSMFWEHHKLNRKVKVLQNEIKFAQLQLELIDKKMWKDSRRVADLEMKALAEKLNLKLIAEKRRTT